MALEQPALGDAGLAGRLSVARTASILLITLLLIFTGVISVWLYQSYDAANRQMAERVIAGAKIVDTHANWINTLALQALQRIDEAMPDAIAISATQQVRNIDDAVKGLPGKVKAYVLDAAGNTVYSTDPDLKKINITDRDYFAMPAKGAPDYVSSLLVSRLNGHQIFVFSRRLTRNGAFAGVAAVSFDMQVLKSIWDAIDLGPNSAVVLMRQDGMLVGRYPLADRPLDMTSHVLFTKYLPKSDEGIYLAVSPFDGTDRVVAYRKVEGTPFIAVSTADSGLGMHPFWHNVYAAIAVLFITLAATAIAAWWIHHLLQRDKCKTRTLLASNAEKSMLLQEIHHRVKNNLQSVQSLIRMHNLPVELDKALGSRIKSMVAVHEHIYKRDQFHALVMEELVRSVVNDLVKSYQCDGEVRYTVDSLAVSNDCATPWALLINEVVTNAIKYASGEARTFTLSIDIKAMSAGRARLSISDNGPGFDVTKASQGMGRRLIKAVTAQLNGQYAYTFSNGTTFVAELDLTR